MEIIREKFFTINRKINTKLIKIESFFVYVIFLIFDKNLLSLERRIDKSQLYVKEILPQNVVLETDGDAGYTSRDYSL